MNASVHSDPDHICSDDCVLHAKAALLQDMKQATLLSSISDAAKFVAGPLFAIGASSLILSTTGPLTGLLLLAVAATTLAVGIATGYEAGRIFQGSNIDTLELNAQSTAHHLVKELEGRDKPAALLIDQPKRPDGKTWQEAVTASPAASAGRGAGHAVISGPLCPPITNASFCPTRLNNYSGWCPTLRNIRNSCPGAAPPA